MRDRRWPVWVVVLLLVSTTLLVVSFVGGDALGPTAPSSSGPISPWAFSSGLSAYDPADGYDLFLLDYGSTWTYAHGDWSNITATAGIPVGMAENSRLTYDAADGYLLLYGGASGTLAEHPLTNTWAFQGGRWTNLTASVRGAPPSMVLGVMTYDSEDKAVVLFGGSLSLASDDGSGPATNQSWTYAAGVWTNATVPGPPPLPGVYDVNPFVGFVDDPADGYVLYYYSLEGGPLASPITWTYHGGAWANRTVTFAPAPHLVLLDTFTYDTTTGTVVAAATCRSTSDFSCAHYFGTFVFSAGNWKDVTPATGPGSRGFAGSANDPSDGGVMIVGGCCWADFSGLSLGWQDYWVYSHGSWTEFNPWGGSAPSWAQNDGSWMALAIAVTAAVGIAVTLRTRHPR